MGLLDDAIREHLELRRRTGADPSEVARLEQEALGPVVRGESPAEMEPEVPAELDLDDGQLAIDDPAVTEQPAPEPAPSEEVVSPESYEAVAPSPERPDLGPAEPHEPPPPAPEDGAPSVSPASVGQPTEEYDVDAVHAAVHGDGAPSVEHARPAHEPAGEPAPERAGEDHAHSTDEDVLEQTPEFLEETPEHDRLWFEQAPPKDFDFDK